MKEMADSFIKYINLPAWAFIVVAGTGTVTLIFKNYLNKNFGTSLFFEKFGAIIFLVTVLSYFLTIASFCRAKKKKIDAIKYVEGKIKYVKELDSRKLGIIRSIYYSPGHVAGLKLFDSDVRELQTAGVIAPVLGREERMVDNPEDVVVCFLVEPWARDIFLKIEKDGR